VEAGPPTGEESCEEGGFAKEADEEGKGEGEKEHYHIQALP